MLPVPILAAVAAVGSLTILVTGLMAIAQHDLKRLLASSTSSQLGFMLLALGAGSAPAALVHLIAHAAMKSALFLGSGVLQHAYATTDLDGLRGGGRRLVWTFVPFAIAGLALAGVPPLAGFWSKEAIEAAAFSSPWASVLAPTAVAGTLLTGIYIARVLRLLWSGDAAPASVTGLAWLAAVLGPALPFLVSFVGGPLPESTTAILLGVTATFAGLLVGWFTPAVRLWSPLGTLAEAGFRVGGGWLDLAVRPALALARFSNGIDGRLNQAVVQIGRFGLWLAGTSRRLDERGIDALIAHIVEAIRTLGGRARRLQSGLVFRELALAAGATIALSVLLLALR
jgi:NADH-quinone oxidoreductase subunit L